LNEDCGCGADKTHDNWIDDNLSKIDRMVGDTNAGDIGAGGCPPGEHFCAELGKCHSDHAPQIEPLTLMGADVINLQERIRESVTKSLLLEKHFGILEWEAMNDFCLGCSACCGVTNVDTNFLGIPTGVDLECMSCQGKHAPGTVYGPNGLPMGGIENDVKIAGPTDDGGGMGGGKGFFGTEAPSGKIMNEGVQGTKRLLKEEKMECHTMADKIACVGFVLDCLANGNIPMTNPTENTANQFITIYCGEDAGSVSPGMITFNTVGEVNAYTTGFGGISPDETFTMAPDTGSESGGNIGKGAFNKNLIDKLNLGEAINNSLKGDENSPKGDGTPEPCNPANWPGLNSWVKHWTTLPNFSSNNPNQPCQHICKQLATWNTNLASAGPVQANQLRCKIETGNSQHQIHNCSSSNAPAC